MRYGYLFHIVVTLLLVASFTANAQHTLSIEPDDTVYLEVNDWRGQIQWQLSHDQINWSDIPGRTYDTMKYVPEQFPAYFRTKITDGECDPYYTETIEVLEIPVPPSVPLIIDAVEPYGIASMSAVSGAKVSKSGGSPVTARGIVYDTSPNPDVENDNVILSGSGKGSFSALMTGLAPNTTYYVRAFATNSTGTGYGSEHSFTTPTNTVYLIGDQGPAGGIVFYDKGSYSNGWRYLEFAPKGWAGTNDPWVDLEWGCYQTLVGGTSTDIGTGKENTDLILAKGCADPDTPVQLAANAVINGYDDWFLPSRDELKSIYDNLFHRVANFHQTYGFLALTYTCSSELNANSTWGIAFGDGTTTQNLKIIATIAVRPIRRF